MVYKFKKLKVIIILLFLIIFVGIFNTFAETKLSLNIGDRVQIETENKNTNLVNGIKSEFIEGFVAGFENNFLYISCKWETKLYRVVSIDGSIAEFPSLGAKYDSTTKIISGIDINKNTIDIAFSDINYVDVIRQSKGILRHKKIKSNKLHTQLRFVRNYPEIEYEIPIDSIQQIKKWIEKSALPFATGMLTGGTIGLFLGIQYAEDDEPTEDEEPAWAWWSKREYSRGDKILAYTAIGICLGTYIVVRFLGGGISGWENIHVEKFKVSLYPTYKNGIGLSLAARF